MDDKERPLSITLLLLSIAFIIYIIGYTFRLLIGAARFMKNNKNNLQNSNKMNKSSIEILFHKHEPLKNHILNAIFLPLLLIRNQLISVFMVMLSFNPIYQIASCGSIVVVFTIYSLVFCPYPLLLRVCLHIS
jgi:hypothetical protein